MSKAEYIARKAYWACFGQGPRDAVLDVVNEALEWAAEQCDKEFAAHKTSGCTVQLGCAERIRAGKSGSR